MITSPIIALPTPFTDRDEIHEEAFIAYLKFLSDAGVKTVITNGTTGEFSSLTTTERFHVLAICRNHFKGTIINNVSSCSLRECITLAEHSINFADYNLILPPFYFSSPPENGVQAFFAEFIERTELPTILYNFPKHTQFEISASLISELISKSNRIIGVKDSSGNLESASALKQHFPQLKVFLGSDTQALAALESGLDGSVTGGGNPISDLFVRMTDAYFQGKRALAHELQNKISHWTNYRKSLIFEEIPFLKAAISARIPAFPTNVRPPFVMISTEDSGKIKKRLKEVI
jgi:dihydrodipicolinate synthase/N-acetylneuraminate lyase